MTSSPEKLIHKLEKIGVHLLNGIGREENSPVCAVDHGRVIRPKTREGTSVKCHG